MVLIGDRIRAEYREMPGLTLTAEHGCRLWTLDMSTCTAVLTQLIDSGFLCRRDDGSYARASDLAIRRRMAKAGVAFIEADHPRRAEG